MFFDEILISYKNSLIAYMYVSSLGAFLKDRERYLVRDSIQTIDLDLCILDLDIKENGSEVIEFIEKLPYVSEFEINHLILNSRNKALKLQNAYFLDLCSEIAFSRHFTGLYVIKKKQSVSS